VSGLRPGSHRRGHWFEPSIAHLANGRLTCPNVKGATWQLPARKRWRAAEAQTEDLCTVSLTLVEPAEEVVHRGGAGLDHGPQLLSVHAFGHLAAAGVTDQKCDAHIPHTAQQLTSFGDEPPIVVTAGKDAQAGWLPLQDKMALLSSNSVHRVLPNVTHSSLVEDQHDSTGASSAIIDVVHAVRSGTGHEASTGIFSPDLAVRDASSSQRSADVRDDPGAGASGGNGIMLLALTPPTPR
jgi:hypothetical protein